MNERYRQFTLKGLTLIATFSLGMSFAEHWYSPYRTWIVGTDNHFAVVHFAETQFYMADSENALKAQNQLLSYLASTEKKRDQWNKFGVPWMTDQVLGYERALTYARIAIVQERLGENPESSWAKAEEQARLVKWREPSRERIRAVVAHFEREVKNLNAR